MKKILKTLAMQLLAEDKTDIEVSYGVISNAVQFTILNLDIEVQIYVDNTVQCDIMELVTLIDNDELSVMQIIITQI